VGTWLAGIPLTSGVGYVTLTLVGAAGFALLVGWRRSVPAWRLAPLACGVLLVVIGVDWLIERVLRPFPDALPAVILAWSALGLFGLGLAVYRAARARGAAPGRVAFVVAGLLVVAWSANGVNREYGDLPTVGDLLGLAPANTMTLPDPPALPVATQRPGVPLERIWSAPPDLPAAGRVVAGTRIPGSVSGFVARLAWVYVPPAYLVTTRPALPVLVLVPGQPGSPRDWFDGGRLASTLDAFAAAHNGLAPIVVVPDALGALYANPLCLDSRLGNVETYLARDVPAWVVRTFAVDQDPAAWAVGGFSYGGTCALQLAVRAPQVYRTFIDISGQREPTLGTRARTVAVAFGGDQGKFVQVNPLDVMSRQQFPDTGGYFVVGTQDAIVQRELRAVDQAAQACGMQTSWVELPGTHSWQVAAPGLAMALPWVAVRMGLISA
jgi:S-formylglutathione hydrolase FrmB